MILVTGAAGKTGRAVTRAAAARGLDVRALVHRPEQAGPVQVAGAAEAIAADLRDPAALRRAARGAAAIYHICPNVSPDEVAIGEAAIAAARAAGVERFVYHSVLHPQTEAMPHHWRKLRVEELLFESGLEVTILQPAAYMQNVLAHWRKIVAEGVYPVPYPAGTRLVMVDLADVADAAAIVLENRGHGGATYELAGPDVLTQTEVADILAARLGRQVRVENVPLEAWEHQARADGMDDDRIDTLLRMFRYYAQHGLWGCARVLEWLLGRPPATFSTFVDRSIGKMTP